MNLSDLPDPQTERNAYRLDCSAEHSHRATRNTLMARACWRSSDGDKIFSTFDTRDLDKSQPKMGIVGTHIITGGTGK